MRKRSSSSSIQVLASGLAMISLVTGKAFVLEIDDFGTSRHWDLLTPETHVPVNAYIHVSTNLVNPATKSIRYFLGADAFSKTNATAELNAIRSAFSQWQNVPGTHLKFEEGGLVSTGADVNLDDDKNLIYFSKSSLVAGQTVDIGTSLALTFYAVLDDLMVNSDTVINADPFKGNYQWYTDYDSPATDPQARFVEAIALHEIGHMIGLEHSPVGGATMFTRTLTGITPQLGLAVDDITGAQYRYPAGTFLSSRGTIAGKVLKNGSGVFCAAVIAEDATTGWIAGTVTRAGGVYEIQAVPPGAYGVRACPLDPAGAGNFMIRGVDIINPTYSGADSSFLATPNTSVTVKAAATSAANFNVTGSLSPLRIASLRKPVTDAAVQTRANAPYVLKPGQGGVALGVYGTGYSAGATLRVTGDGVSVTALPGTSQFAGLDLVSIILTVNANATPGLRTLILEQGANVAYANGFIDIQPTIPDLNGDGLDDTFQRRYFSPWTSAAAGPSVDADADGFNNLYEYYSGSNPANAASLPTTAVTRITQTTQGTTVYWRSVPGGKYQVQRRGSFTAGDPWKNVGSVVTAADTAGSFLDTTATSRLNFYRIQLLPTQ